MEPGVIIFLLLSIILGRRAKRKNPPKVYDTPDGKEPRYIAAVSVNGYGFNALDQYGSVLFSGSGRPIGHSGSSVSVVDGGVGYVYHLHGGRNFPSRLKIKLEIS